jgi:hypothetical protein
MEATTNLFLARRPTSYLNKTSSFFLKKNYKMQKVWSLSNNKVGVNIMKLPFMMN